MGKWFVISAIPNFVEKGCEDAYDIYVLNSDGTVGVEYHAFKNGKPFTIKLEGTFIDTIHNSTWVMRFTKPWVPFFSAPYEVIMLDKQNYDYMVIGYPNNDYGWIMSRYNVMNNDLYYEILQVLESDFNYKKDQFSMIKHNYK